LAIGLSVLGMLATSLSAQPSVGPDRASVPPVIVQSPRMVNGWRGAVWGMTPEQVGTVLKQPLGERKQSSSKSPNSPFHKYSHRDLAAGDWPVNVDLFFRASSAEDSFTGVMLQYPQQAGFGSIRDELTATYGPPTSQENQGGRERVTWRFPGTNIICERLTFANSIYMGVVFEQLSK
jgi:hypothetical protein